MGIPFLVPLRQTHGPAAPENAISPHSGIAVKKDNAFPRVFCVF